jgi:predicted  nucleic acid-binding Zn-ribbon protein
LRSCVCSCSALGAVVKTAERRETELQAELEGANKSLKELENTIRVLQIRHETEVSKLKDEHLGACGGGGGGVCV